MVRLPEKQCLPMEYEHFPLYREPGRPRASRRRRLEKGPRSARLRVRLAAILAGDVARLRGDPHD